MGLLGQAIEDVAWLACHAKVFEAAAAPWHSKADADPLAALEQVEGGELFLRELLLQRTAPFAPNNTEDPRLAAPPGCLPADVSADWPGRRLPLQGAAALTVVWDALDRRSAAMARALRHEFPGLCSFVELHDPALEALLAQHPGLAESRRHICREGGLSAILASGVFITRCEDHPKVLLFELLYRRTVRLPSEKELAELEACFLEPLQRLRRPGQPRWWLSPGALQLVAASLEKNRFAIIDGLLDEAEVQSLREIAQRFFREQQMRAGIEEQRGGYGGYWGDGNEGDFQNQEGLPRKWTMEGDFRSWVADDDARAPALRLLTSATDALVTALKDERLSFGLEPEVAARMRRVDFRESTMVACYPGETRGKYLRHCDTGRGAALTVILYLNEGWKLEDGGQLRMYGEGFHNTQVKYDVMPVANRLLLFWATEECPHEVLPTLRDRFAMTIWYRDSSNLDAAGLADTAVRCTPVAPLSLEDAVRRAGAPERQAERLELLARLRHALAQPEDSRASALGEVLMTP